MLHTRLVAALGAVAFVTSIDSAGAATYAVGHTVKRIEVAGTAPNELRAVDVHLWYPADAASALARPLTVYRSALYGKPLPAQWDPLAWSLTSKLAREDASVESAAKPFPVIVFSHGSVNDPLNEASMLELIAGAGFVVASPAHVTDTQDDVRIDYINQQAGTRLFQCNDGHHAHRPGGGQRVLEARLGGQPDRAQPADGRPLPGHLEGPGFASRLGRRSSRHGQGRRPRALARDAQRARRRGREHDVGRREGAAGAGGDGHGQRRHAGRDAPAQPRRRPRPHAVDRRRPGSELADGRQRGGLRRDRRRRQDVRGAARRPPSHVPVDVLRPAPGVRRDHPGQPDPGDPGRAHVHRPADQQRLGQRGRLLQLRHVHQSRGHPAARRLQDRLQRHRRQRAHDRALTGHRHPADGGPGRLVLHRQARPRGGRLRERDRAGHARADARHRPVVRRLHAGRRRHLHRRARPPR